MKNEIFSYSFLLLLAAQFRWISPHPVGLARNFDYLVSFSWSLYRSMLPVLAHAAGGLLEMENQQLQIIEKSYSSSHRLSPPLALCFCSL